MSDDFKSRRDEVVAGSSSDESRRRLLAVGAFVITLAGAAWYLLVIAPDEAAGPSTSQPAEMQDPENLAGVDTTLPLKRTVETPAGTPGQTEMASADPEEPANGGADAADRARIAALEQQIKDLQAASGSRAELDAALQKVRVDMQAGFDRVRVEADETYRRLLAQASVETPSNATGMSDEERDGRQRLEEERQRRVAIAEAQIMSDGIVLDASGATIGGGSRGGSSGGGSKGGAGPGGRSASHRDLSTNEAFMAEATTQNYQTVRATRIAAPDRTIVQGTTLNAVLETAINTELPGVIRAVVTDDALSYDGTNVLLPKGTRLIGSYNSDVSVLQGRVQLAWNRAVTPEGVSVELGGYGADALGRSGQSSGFVDTRFRQRFGSATLISLISAGPNIVVTRSTGGLASDTVQDVGDNLTNASQGALDAYLTAGPVIHVDQGTEMTVFVNRDLVL